MISTLERIIGPPAAPGMFNDPTDPARQSMYKSRLMSELGVVIAPRALSPADTLGYSGFQLAFETSFTQISNTPTSGRRAWRTSPAAFCRR